MPRLSIPLATVCLLLGAFPAPAQYPMPKPSRLGSWDKPIIIAALEYAKDKCNRESPCKYKISDDGVNHVVVLENKEGRTTIVMDKDRKLVKRTDE